MSIANLYGVLVFALSLISANARLLQLAHRNYNQSWIVPDVIVYRSSNPSFAHCAGKRELDIVLTGYHEDVHEIAAALGRMYAIPYIAQSRPCIFLYDKGNRHAAVAAIDKVYEVITQPNVGREAQTMLKHIVRHYEQLPSKIVFSQAVPNFPDVFFGRLATINPSTGFLPLGMLSPCNCDGCIQGRVVRVREMWAMLRSEFCEEPYLAALNGQFVVSSKRILNIRLSKYLTILTYLFAPADHYIHKDPKLTSPWVESWLTESNNNNPLLLHAIERVWSFMYDCKDLSLMDNCCNTGFLPPTCNFNCQCLDG